MTARPRTSACLLILLAGFGLPSLDPAKAADDHVFFHENVMGTSLELKVRADSAASASRAESRVLAEIDRLSAILSGYDATSEFRLWSDHPAGPVAVSTELFDVLAASDLWQARQPGGVRPEGAGLVGSVDPLFWGKPPAHRLGKGRGPAPWPANPPGNLTPRPAPPRGSTALRRLERHRQGIHCRAGLRGRHEAGRGRSGGDPQRRRRPAGRGALSAQVGIVPPWSDSETSAPLRLVDASRPGPGHQRTLSEGLHDSGSVVFSYY